LLALHVVFEPEHDMAERYWSDSDAQWPEGHEFDARTNRFEGMDRAAAAPAMRAPRPVGTRRMARAYRRTDERIRDDVCERLAHSNAVDPSDVSVDVRDGIVTLEGSVPQRPMRYALEDIAARCMGVVDVDNRVRVGPSDG
jgi:osmotically-inducible protein OsmY